MTNLLSVIVPVFNTKSYLDRCFGSLIKQSYRNIQVIFVDDGSTDGSSEICDNYSKKFENVKTIHTSNLGVSHARNIGIKNSDGNLIAFLDSDDYISPTFYEELISQLPAFAFGKISIDTGDKIKPILEHNMNSFVGEKNIKYFIVGDEEIETETFYKKARIFGSACRSVFLKTIIDKNNLSFNENLTVGEDLVFVLNYLSYVDNLVNVNAEYFYNRNSSSATASQCEGYLTNYLTKYKLLTDEIILCISNSKIDSLLKKRLVNYQKMKFVLGFVINELALSKNNKRNLKKFFKTKDNRNYLKFSISSVNVLEKLTFRRKVLLLLIKFRMYKIIKVVLRGNRHD